MSERRNEILQVAVEMIAADGYASLTMRALAREVGMKLASLQYHFKNSDELLRGVVAYVGESYHRSFAALAESGAKPDLAEITTFVMDDEVGASIAGDRLWPQLWAMQQIEPLVSELVEEIYARYLEVLEIALKEVGSKSPRPDALFLMSALEGSTIFLGEGRRWQKDEKAVRATVLEFIEQRYSEKRDDTGPQ